MNNQKELNNFLTKMPKVELHIHLEGSIPLKTLYKIINKYDNSNFTQKKLAERFKFKSFPHFIDRWRWKNTFLREYDDVERLAESVASDLKKQNIKYAEMNYSPPLFKKRYNLEVDKLTEAIRKGFDKVDSIKINLLFDFCRNSTTVENGLIMLEKIYEVRDLGVIGVDLGGSEHLVPPEKWKKAYERAKTMGFHRTAHAGEAAGPQSIWGAINSLQVERIGYGTRAVEDNALLDYLNQTQSPIELCPISNVKTAVVNSLENHPVRLYFDRGLNVFINTDDPKMFQTSLQQEYLSLIKVHNFTLREIKQLVKNAIKATWCNQTEKDILNKEIDHYFYKTVL